MPGSKRVEITDISGSKMPDLKKRKGRGNRLSGSSHSSTSETSKGSLRNQNAPADTEEQESVYGEEVFIEELADISQVRVLPPGLRTIIRACLPALSPVGCHKQPPAGCGTCK